MTTDYLTAGNFSTDPAVLRLLDDAAHAGPMESPLTAELADTLRRVLAANDRAETLFQAIKECHLDPAGAVIHADRIAGAAIFEAHWAKEANIALAEENTTLRTALEEIKDRTRHTTNPHRALSQIVILVEKVAKP